MLTDYPAEVEALVAHSWAAFASVERAACLEAEVELLDYELALVPDWHTNDNIFELNGNIA